MPLPGEVTLISANSYTSGTVWNCIKSYVLHKYMIIIKIFLRGYKLQKLLSRPVILSLLVQRISFQLFGWTMHLFQNFFHWYHRLLSRFKLHFYDIERVICTWSRAPDSIIKLLWRRENAFLLGSIHVVEVQFNRSLIKIWSVKYNNALVDFEK